MRHMAAIPESTRSSVALRLLDHAGQHWPQLHRVQVTSRAGFAYVTGILPDGEQIPLYRLRYGGSAHSFGSRSTPPPGPATRTPSWSPDHRSAHPQEAHDTACTVHLAGLGHEPPTNLRAHPLKLPVPFDLGQFVAALERQRARPIRLRPFSSAPGCPRGLWIGTADADYIYHEAGTTPFHATHIALHEIAHMLLGHRYMAGWDEFISLLAPDRRPGSHPADSRPQRLWHGGGAGSGDPCLPHLEQYSDLLAADIGGRGSRRIETAPS